MVRDMHEGGEGGMAMWVTHGMMRAMCQAHRKEGDEFKWEENRWRNPTKKGKKQREKEGEKERKEREKERKREREKEKRKIKEG